MESDYLKYGKNERLNFSENTEDKKDLDGSNSIIPQNNNYSIPQQSIVCKLIPFNICYRSDELGNLHPLQNRKPVRLIRIYK